GTPAGGRRRRVHGPRYLHNRLLGASALAAALATAAGTETGEFEYDVPGTANFAIDAAGRSYGSLTLTRSAGPATYTATGSAALTVRGMLTTNTKVAFSS